MPIELSSVSRPRKASSALFSVMREQGDEDDGGGSRNAVAEEAGVTWEKTTDDALVGVKTGSSPFLQTT